MKRKLTERVIGSLRTQKAQEDVFHTLTPSAGLRLTGEGRKTWFILYRSPAQADGPVNSKLRRYYFGEHPSGKAGQGTYLTLEEFRRAYEIFRGELAKGIDPQDKTVQQGAADEERTRHHPPAAVPQWLRSTFPEGYAEGTFAHKICLYFEAARTGTGIKKLAPRTLKGYVSSAKTHLLKPFGNCPATSITQDFVCDLFADLAKKSPPDGTAGQEGPFRSL